MSTKQEELKETIDLLSLINQLEVKGQGNIYILYNVIGFLQKKITDTDKELKEGG